MRTFHRQEVVVAVVLAGVLFGGPGVAPSPGAVTNAIGLNFGADFKLMSAEDAAGITAVATNWNNIAGTNGVNTGLIRDDGGAAGITVTRVGFEGGYWARTDGLSSNGHERLMWGYQDNRSSIGGGSSTVTVSGVTAPLYDVYAYFGSDGDNRRGSVGLVGRETYSFRTWSRNRSFPGAYLRTTDVSTNWPQATYAVWTNVTGSSFAITFDAVFEYSAGLNGIQIVWHGEGGAGEGLPAINNAGGASDVTANQAWLNGTLTSTGASATAVWVFWGTNDQQQSTSGWSGLPVSLGSNVSTGALSTLVAGLTPGTTYFYRYYASNTVGEVWATPAATFSTLGPPAIQNGQATVVGATTAWVPGLLTSTGGSPTTVWIHYARQPDTWPSATRVSAGQQGVGVFSNLVTGLRPSTTYYYRLEATNAAGYSAWAPTTNQFTTAPLPPAIRYVGLKLGADFSAMLPEDSAGALVTFTNWNNVFGTNQLVSGLHDSDGVATDLILTRSGFEGSYVDFGRVSAANGDERLVWSYLDNTIIGDSAATLMVSGIEGDSFDVYVYVGSDNPNRRGTVGIAGYETFSYTTLNAESAYPASHARTTDTGLNYPFANYAVWTNLTGTELALTITSDIDYASGINGIQIVMHSASRLPGSPDVTALAASPVLARSAVANGMITSTGSTATAVALYWGDADAGRTSLGWSGGGIELGPVVVEVPPSRALIASLTGLLPERTYVYRFVASNDIQEVWSDAVSFTTAFDPTAYAHHMPITFSGYTRPETLFNFPALVALSNGVGGSGFHFSQFISPSGHDLRFSSSNWTQRLNHEVEHWDTKGVASLWVQVPALSDTNTFIWAHWGYAETAGAPAPWTLDGSAWNATHAGVWHFAESGSTLADSTGEDRNGTNVGTTPAPGIVAGARAFNGLNASITLNGNLAGVLGGDLATFSFWMKATNTINNGTSYNGSAFLGDDVPDASDSWWGMTQDGQIGTKIGNRDAVLSTAPITNGTWRMITLTRDPNNGMLEVYLDDTLDKAELSEAGINQGNVLNTFGRNVDGLNGGYVVGTFDEVRVRPSVSSADWVWASYMTVASNGTFAAYNTRPEVALPTGILLTIF